jgi:UDP-N-acetylmuramoylalanine--D-glutamate ligase
VRSLADAGAEVVWGSDAPANLDGRDLVIWSPGVPVEHPTAVDAKRRGIPVLSELELGYLAAHAPLVCVTGTNGKSTTTALTGALLARDRRTFTGGNLGTPLCDHVLSGAVADAIVLELSSFQIDGLSTLRPRVAAILNVTPDHLDRYRDVDAYAASKARLFGLLQPGDAAVANARDPRALAMAAGSRADVYTFGFGPPAPASARDPGGEPGPAGAELWVRIASARPERYVVRSRALRGRHNRENAMAAVLCARLAGVPGDAIQAGLDAFPGLPHRLELVAERSGVEWVNDSKATNVDSTSVGLAAFPEGAARVVLIMGGRGKGAPYAPLRPLFARRVKALLTIGEDAPAVQAQLGDLAPTEPCGDLAAAVKRAARLAGPGDVVLLSPACASYDQYRSYEERGEHFRRLAAEVA